MSQKYPCVGQTVLWYDRGDTGAAPFVGIVTESQDGVLSLVAFGKYSSMGKIRQGVRHVSHELMQNKHIAADTGGWDWIEKDRPTITLVAEPQKPAEEPPAKTASKQKPALQTATG